MVVARASGTLIASSLKQNTFLTLKLCPAGGSPPYIRSPKCPPADVGGGAGRNYKVKKVFCFKLDAMSVPEALATTIRILLMFAIVLVHQ